ncbi:MAG: SAF domain-containing protein [Chloroflexota bacterium]
MKKKHPKQNSLEEKNNIDGIRQLEDTPRKTLVRRQRPKREGCVSVSLAGNTTTNLAGNKGTSLFTPGEKIPGERSLMRAALAGNAATVLAGKVATSLDGDAIASLAGKPGTSLVILAKKEIPKGAVIKKVDLDAYVISEPLTSPDMAINKNIPLGTVAKKNIPAYSLIASVLLAGTPSTSVSELKLPPGSTLVIQTKKPIKKGTIIQEADLDVSVISSPIKSPDMYVSKANLVGKVAKENIEENRILKKSMVR